MRPTEPLEPPTELADGRTARQQVPTRTWRSLVQRAGPDALAVRSSARSAQDAAGTADAYL